MPDCHFRLYPEYRDQRHSKITHLGEQAVQRRLIDDRSGDQGHAAGLARDLQPVEPGRPALVEDPLDADFITHRLVTPSCAGRVWRTRVGRLTSASTGTSPTPLACVVDLFLH